MNNLCVFCNSVSLHMRTTLYGVFICEDCDDLIKKRGVKNIETTDITVWDRAKEFYASQIRSTATDKIRISNKSDVSDILRGLPEKHSHALFSHRARSILNIVPSYLRRPGLLSITEFDRLINSYVDETLYSETEEIIKRKSLATRVTAFFAPKSYRSFLSKETSERIEAELNKSANEIKELKSVLKECIVELNRLKLEKEEKIEQEKPLRVEKYARRKALELYPQKVKKIIRIVKEQNILLYEYYFNEYPPDWDLRSKKVKERDNYTCQMCGNNAELLAHHKIPVTAGGSHFLDNLVTLCIECHLVKHPGLKNKFKTENS